jgi:LTXXQ motif family protein
MSRSCVAIAALVLVTALSSAALGRGGGHGGGGGHFGGGGHGGGHFGGGHFGGGHFGGGHFGGGHFRGGHGFAHFGGAHHGGPRFSSHTFSGGHFRSGHAFVAHHGTNFSQIRNAAVRPTSARNAMNALSHGRALRNARLLSNPAARTQIAAAAALAGWHGGHDGWWRHGHGGYGWVGPLFWPFAYYDLYDYTIWGDYGFWDYGYGDIYAGIFGPYGYDDLSGYLAPRRYGRRHATVAPLSRMCGDDSRAIAGLPIDQITQAIEPTETQRAALDELGAASIQAARIIRDACPTQVALTAPGRLTAMQQRIEAMISAVALVRTPLDKLYALLDDEQKARFNALAEDQRKASAPREAPSPTCGVEKVVALDWPADEIEKRLHPTDSQRTALDALRDASAKAADLLKVACEGVDAATPPARLAATARRLDVMLQAIRSVRKALDDFYATLSDEQKAQFEGIGRQRPVS